MFLNTLSISNTFLCVSLKKKNPLSAITEPDQRGKHAPSNKLSDNIIEHVKNHIGSFPSYSSHYSRERTKRKYLAPDMNISKMYQAYIDECEKSCIESTLQAKEWMYRKIFNEQFNLSFHPPYNDTCDECDRLILSEKQENSAEQKLIIGNQRDQHLVETTLRYKLKKEDKIKSNENKDTTVFITMDMQKCLPVPFLHNCQSFYLRKLWVLNETIEDSTNNKSFAFMWDETKAARGANEIASVLYKWIENEVQHKSTINEVNLWTDNCAGQNRNLTIVMAYFWFLFKYPNLQEINHKFLLRGHTHLEVDSVHSVIERKKKRFPLLSLSVPKDWEQLFVETARVKNPITVQSMEIEDFKNFEKLYNGNNAPFVSRKKNDDGDLFYISKVVWIQAKKDNLGVLYYKTDFNEAEFKTINLNRNKRKVNNKSIIDIPNSLPQVRSTLKPINTLKFQNLQTLLKWIPPIYHDYFKNLPHAENTKNGTREEEDIID